MSGVVTKSLDISSRHGSMHETHMATDKPQHRLMLILPRDLHTEVRTLAEKEHRSVSAEIRRALEHYVEHEKATA